MFQKTALLKSSEVPVIDRMPEIPTKTNQNVNSTNLNLE